MRTGRSASTLASRLGVPATSKSLRTGPIWAPSNPRLLLLVKRLFDEAKRDSAFGNKLASTKALLLLDVAVEQMLNTVISDFPSQDLVTKEGLSCPGLVLM